MDPPQEGLDELEKALAEAHLTQALNERVSSNQSNPKSTHASRTIPIAVVDSPDSDSEPVSPLSNGDDDHEPFDGSITPPLKQHQLSRHNSGLPPTPPTMTNSDIAESKTDRIVSPAPLFADRVRNALEAQKSGLSTPGHESHSPPTPDPSPPGVFPRLDILRPELNHFPSTQSHADSFKTATEGHSINESSSRENLQEEDGAEEQKESVLGTPKATRLAIPDIGNGRHSPLSNDESDRGEVRVKNYQMESDSDMERPVRLRTYDGHSSNDDSPTSPTLRKALEHRTAYQRLRKPIQPGDSLKRPDEALLYGSLGSWKRPGNPVSGKAQPKREMDTEFLRNAELVESKSPEPVIDLASEPAIQQEQEPAEPVEPESPKAPVVTPDRQHDSIPTDTSAKLEPPIETPAKLREFAPSEAPPEPSPPTTAQKASLEENNLVYRMIQEENAKRHSATSDGSVQAVVVPVPDRKRKLRHTPKRESLRADASMASNSKRSSSESGHKLRHKRAMPSLGTSDGASPEVFPDQEPTKFSARISRFNPGENGFDYWSAIPDSTPSKQVTVEAKISPRVAAPSEQAFKPRRLRRSQRERGLDRHGSLQDEAQARPWSMDGSALPESTPSPKLRRFSNEKRLENNNDVRRTSLSRDSQIAPYANGDVKRADFGRESHASQSIEVKLGKLAEELTREGREMPDRMSIREHRTSSDKSMATISPRRKSFDPRYLHPNGTPFSTSQFSDRTEAEVLEARGVELFPHNNESLLLVEQSSRPVSKPLQVDEKDVKVDDADTGVERSAETALEQPVFKAVVEPADSMTEIGKAKHSVDSPLTNPRAAPEPPIIKCIPPTPNEELERVLGEPQKSEADPRKNMQRRMSLTQKMRRYSESLIQPLPFGRTGSFRKQGPRRVVTMPEGRPTHLSSFWQPRDFWEEYDSDEESDDIEPLPRGGDTSDVADKRRSFFPRQLSVRMPGFRGNDGFLLGNSLGIDRHGTNKRRHYVNTRTSEEMLRRLAERKRRRTFTLPFSGGARVEYVGLAAFGAKIRDTKKRRQEKALEKRREKLRGQIGTRVYHDGRCGVP